MDEEMPLADANGDDESAAGERNYPASTEVENNGEPPPIETSTDNNKVESDDNVHDDGEEEEEEDDDDDDMGSVVKEPEPTTPNTLVLGSETEYEIGVDEPPKKLKEEGTVPTEENGDKKKKNSPMEQEVSAEEHPPVNIEDSGQTFYLDRHIAEGDESGNEEEQTAFIKDLENFFRERNMEFKPPKFYGEGLNCLKLWRAVIRLGGYDQVTTNKLWRQVGQYFKPPKTCTTVSWTFRCFYEKALLDFERHKIHGGEIHVPVSSLTDPISVVNPLGDGQASGSGRARRDAAARAMQGWHSRLLGNSEVGDPLIKDKNSISGSKREKQLKSFGVLKRKKPSDLDYAVKASHNVAKTAKIQMEMTTVVDIGPVADWVKVNVRRTRDCFEVYALVPGLLREEVRVQSDPAGRLVISGEPEQPDNPWGVTPFKKVINLPSRIDPHQTSAIVTLHGQLFVRVPFDQSYS